MDIYALVFYMFAIGTVLCAVAVISARNPVYSVLFLIAAFFNSAGLFVLIGAEYLAMTLVIVYVGAVAILFLFVVMMLNVNFAALKQGFLHYLPVGLGIAGVLVAELYWMARVTSYNGMELAARTTPTPDSVSNAKAIGNVLYTDYMYPFQMAGIILLVAMIGAIVLTHRTRGGVRKQRISAQIARRRKDCVELVDVEVGKGI
ncbi:MAG: NADH-quinone oxidoreductase subunit J [Alphaproteobacteria bacterium]|nr:NADH-quinone oxidoreductase subunit J [Alphaproteobacteria bacterium]